MSLNIGYGGATPVRVGNAAYGQRQNDNWGALVDAAYVHCRARGHLPERIWQLVYRMVEAAVARWREPDRGMWEVRGEPQHFTSSKLMCWVAAERGTRLADLRGDAGAAQRWRAAAAEIHADICAHAVNGRGTFTQHYGPDAPLDASGLLIPLVGFLPPEDTRVRATVLAIADQLCVDELVLRYRVEETDDGLSGEEATFVLCTFWLVSALARIGEVARARALAQKMLDLAGPMGLYAEEVDPGSGRHWGNFPQAFSHLGLIEALLDVIRAEGVESGR